MSAVLPPGSANVTIAADASGRVFDHAKIWELTQDVFEDAARRLAEAEPRPDIVVGIARGGVPLARLLGEWFGVPVAEIGARHNCGDGAYASQSAVVEVSGRLPRLGKAAPAVLVADDICGTGETIRAILRHIGTDACPGRVRTVALCRNVGASFLPDAWIWDTRDWVVFPWDRPASGPAEPLVLPAQLRGRELP